MKRKVWKGWAIVDRGRLSSGNVGNPMGADITAYDVFPSRKAAMDMVMDAEMQEDLGEGKVKVVRVKIQEVRA